MSGYNILFLYLLILSLILGGIFIIQVTDQISVLQLLPDIAASVLPIESEESSFYPLMSCNERRCAYSMSSIMVNIIVIVYTYIHVSIALAIPTSLHHCFPLKN